MRSGFTMVEVLLVLMMFTAVAAISIPLSIDYQQRGDIDMAQATFSQGLRRAQQLSMSGEGNSAWGINAVSGKITVFKGATYATRDTTYDEDYSLSTAVVMTNQLEYDFAKTTGLPAQTGTATFTNGAYQKTVTVNAKGVVNY